MTCKGTIRGNCIQISERLPFDEGETVTVTVQSMAQDALGSPARLLRAVLEAPHVDPSIVDELERAIEESKQPVNYKGIFDSEADL